MLSVDFHRPREIFLKPVQGHTCHILQLYAEDGGRITLFLEEKDLRKIANLINRHLETSDV